MCRMPPTDARAIMNAGFSSQGRARSVRHFSRFGKCQALRQGERQRGWTTCATRVSAARAWYGGLGSGTALRTRRQEMRQWRARFPSSFLLWMDEHASDQTGHANDAQRHSQGERKPLKEIACEPHRQNRFSQVGECLGNKFSSLRTQNDHTTIIAYAEALSTNQIFWGACDDK